MHRPWTYPAVLMASAVILGSPGHARATTRELPAESAWVLVAEIDGVLIEAGPSTGDFSWVRGRSHLPIAAERVREQLSQIESLGGLFASIVEWKLLATSPTQPMVYGRHHLPWPFSDRDYVVRYRWQTLADRWLLEAEAQPGFAAQEVPRPAGVVRLQQMFSRWEVRPVGATLSTESADVQCEVRYIYNGDLGGNLPQRLARRAWQSDLPKVFAALRVRLGLARSVAGGDRGLSKNP